MKKSTFIKKLIPVSRDGKIFHQTRKVLLDDAPIRSSIPYEEHEESYVTSPVEPTIAKKSPEYKLPDRDMYHEHLALQTRIVQAVNSIKNKYKNNEITRTQYKGVMSEIKPYLMAHRKAKFARHAAVILGTCLTVLIMAAGTVGSLPISPVAAVIGTWMGAPILAREIVRPIYNKLNKKSTTDIAAFDPLYKKIRQI